MENNNIKNKKKLIKLILTIELIVLIVNIIFGFVLKEKLNDALEVAEQGRSGDIPKIENVLLPQY